jgi:hypothetical protein
MTSSAKKHCNGHQESLDIFSSTIYNAVRAVVLSVVVYQKDLLDQLPFFDPLRDDSESEQNAAQFFQKALVCSLRGNFIL